MSRAYHKFVLPFSTPPKIGPSVARTNISGRDLRQEIYLEIRWLRWHCIQCAASSVGIYKEKSLLSFLEISLKRLF